MNRDELIEKVARRLAGDDGKVWWTNAIPAVYFDQARAVLPLIEADVRKRLMPAPDDLVTECLSIAYRLAWGDRPMTDRITLTRSHVPNCACAIDDDGNNLQPDPVCEDWSKIVTKGVESIVAARCAEALRDAAARFRLGKNESLHWYTVAQRLDNQANEYDPKEET